MFFTVYPEYRMLKPVKPVFFSNSINVLVSSNLYPLFPIVLPGRPTTLFLPLGLVIKSSKAGGVIIIPSTG